jgi:hypothetical protein
MTMGFMIKFLGNFKIQRAVTFNDTAALICMHLCDTAAQKLELQLCMYKYLLFVQDGANYIFIIT